MRICVIFYNFAALFENKILHAQSMTIRYINMMLIVCVIMGLSGCRKSTPQQVRHLGKDAPVDSALLAKMEFNQRMANAADKECLRWVQSDSLDYILDEFGFWYRKDVKVDGTPLTRGQSTQLHVVVRELDGNVLADLEDEFVLGSDNMPMVMNRVLKTMCVGERTTTITPWYLAYGAEGKGIIKPYTNLIIIIEVKE